MQKFNTIHDVTTSVGRHLSHRRRVLHRVFDDATPGADLNGEEGSTLLAQVCTRIEAELERRLRSQPGFKFFAGTRQLSPRLWAHLDDEGWQFHETARNIAELAVHRYADWTAPLSPDLTREPVWTHATTERLADVLVLAEYYGNTLAARRRVAKGQTSRLQDADRGLPWRWLDDEANGGLEQLISVLDRRKRADVNLIGAYGGHLTSASDGEVTDRIIAAELVDPTELRRRHTAIDEVVPILVDGQADEARRRTEQVARWGWHPDLGPRQAAVAEYDEAFRGALGFGLRDIEFCLDVCSSKVIAAWDGTPPFLDDQGFALAPCPATSDFEGALTTSRQSGYEDWKGVTVDGAVRALSFLDSGTHTADLSNPLAGRPVRIVDGTMLYDGVHVRFPSPLVWEVTLADDIRHRLALRFEAGTHERLALLGQQPWATGKELTVGGLTFTDVDASVVVDDLLVVVDCYGSRWSPQLDIGTHAQTRNREQGLVKKLDKWDRQWASVAADHSDVLPQGVERILPVVVTVGAEWLSSLEPRLWFRDDRPRICTLDELIDEIREYGSCARRADIVASV